MDFVLSNKWVFDYVTLTDRLTKGVEADYPLPIPFVDWWWMIAGAVCLVLCAVTYFQCKGAQAEVEAQAKAKAAEKAAAAAK